MEKNKKKISKLQKESSKHLNDPLKKVKKIISSIQDRKNFHQAFTHSSYCHEFPGTHSYETLEFLGDSILNFHTSLFVYNSFPNFSEGEMSKLKQLMVRESTLAYLSKNIGLDNFLNLGTGERKNRGSDKDSILADIFESFVAALYLEKGEKEVSEFLNLTLFKWVKGKENLIWDYKSQLQEFCQSQKNRIIYQLKGIEEKEKQKLFIMELRDELETLYEIGKGKSKKEAEQQAAQKAIRKLGLEKKSPK